MSGATGPPKNNGRRWPGPDRRQIEKKNSTNKPSYEPHRADRHKPRLRLDFRFMEPDEMTPEERLDRIVELLAIMSMPDASRPVLNDEIGTPL